MACQTLVLIFPVAELGKPFVGARHVGVVAQGRRGLVTPFRILSIRLKIRGLALVLIRQRLYLREIWIPGEGLGRYCIVILHRRICQCFRIVEFFGRLYLAALISVLRHRLTLLV